MELYVVLLIQHLKYQNVALFGIESRAQGTTNCKYNIKLNCVSLLKYEFLQIIQVR